MNKIELQNWYAEHEIFDQVLEGLWESFYMYKRENPERFMDVFPLERDNVNLRFVKIAVEVPLPDFENEIICVYVDIYTDEVCVGWYKQLFESSGEKQGKYFVIEEKGE